MIEKDIHFFLLSEISVCLTFWYINKNYFFIYWWFANGLKSRRVSILLSITFKTVKSQTREHFIFHLKNFHIFGNLEMDFGINSKKVFLLSYHYFRSYATFLLKFWHTIKQIWSMPSQSRHTKVIVWRVSMADKVLLTKKEEIMDYRGSKNFI